MVSINIGWGRDRGGGGDRDRDRETTLWPICRGWAFQFQITEKSQTFLVVTATCERCQKKSRSRDRKRSRSQELQILDLQYTRVADFSVITTSTETEKSSKIPLKQVKTRKICESLSLPVHTNWPRKVEAFWKSILISNNIIDKLKSIPVIKGPETNGL